MPFFGIFIVHSLCQIAIFTTIWLYYAQNNAFRCTCQKFPITFPLAKASGVLIGVHVAALIVCITMVFQRYIFQYTGFSKRKTLHHYLFCWMVLWTLVHTIAHTLNFQQLTHSHKLVDPYQTWSVGFTGVLLLCIMSFFVILSLPVLQTHRFHIFIASHQFLFVVFMIFFIVHQTFCFIKNDFGNCPMTLSWILVIPPMVVYIGEYIYKYTHKPYAVQHVSFHGVQNQILQVQVRLPPTYAGRVVYVCCEHISQLEWHPFVVSLYNTETEVASIHVSNKGNWTCKLIRSFATSRVCRPMLRIVCAQPSIPIKVSKSVVQAPCIFISTGIGITTFSHLYSQFQNTMMYPCVLYIVTRHPSDVMWLIPTLERLRDMDLIQIELLFTASNLNYAQVRMEIPMQLEFSIGRPCFERLFAEQYINTVHTLVKTNVFFAGSANIFKVVKKETDKYSLYVLHHVT